MWKNSQSPWFSSTWTVERRLGSRTGFGRSFKSTESLVFLFNPVRRMAEMPRAGLPSLRAARVVEEEKLAVCEALENAGMRNPGGSVAERCVVADSRPPIMLRLEQCIVSGMLVACCCCDRWSALTGDWIKLRRSAQLEGGRYPNPLHGHVHQHGIFL